MKTKKLVGARFIAPVLIAALLLLAPQLFAAARIERIDSRFGCVAGEALLEAQVVMMKSDGKCYLADSDDAALRPAIGVAGAKTASGANAPVITRGQVGGLSALTKGGLVYLHTVAGATSQSEGAYSDKVGVAISATQYVLDVFGHGLVATPNDGSITTAKMAASAITPTELASDAVTTVKILASNVTSLKASTPLKTRSHTVSVPDPGAANADITAGYVLWRPSVNVTITKIYMLPETAWVAAASANDATVTVTNAGVGTLTSLNVVTALAVGTANDMGTVTNAAVVANTNVTLTLTTNGTADSPRNSFQIEYLTAD
jgi:hypothetical protein